MTNRIKLIVAGFLAVSALAAALAAPAARSAEFEENARITFLNERGQYIVYGDFKKLFSPLQEVEIMNFDRNMGLGYIEEVSASYMVVRLLWLRPEFFAGDANRVRPVFQAPLPTVKKEIGYDTPIYFGLEEEMNKKIPGMNIYRLQMTPYGEYYKDSDVIIVDPLAEPWKKAKIPSVFGYVIDPEGKIRKLGLQPETSQGGTGEEIKQTDKTETTSRRRRSATQDAGEKPGEKEDLKEK